MSEPLLEEVVLGPGDLYFGGGALRIRTLLGSCVAITLWHPVKRVGGMCHFVTPSRRLPVPAEQRSGRYADEALSILIDRIYAAGTAPREYEVKMFGGGSQFEDGAGRWVDVASLNVDAGLLLLSEQGLAPSSLHVGGTGHRQVVLDVTDGAVWMRHVARTDELTNR